MATLKPFSALRPRPDLASKICELPYDVLSSDEARKAAQGNEYSFFRVSKPEIGLDPSVDVHSPEVYAKGNEVLQDMIQKGWLARDPSPGFYLYRQIMGNHSQVGIVGVASCEEYRRDIVKKHELTRPDKELDRVNHIEVLNSQTGPVFLTYPSVPELDTFVAEWMKQSPDVDFTSRDGVRHTSWSLFDPAGLETIEQYFSRMPCLYIADGHHRSAAASRVDEARKGAGTSGRFLVVVFPHDQMNILPYNRVVKDLNGRSASEFLKLLEPLAEVLPNGAKSPGQTGTVSLYLGNGDWRILRFRDSLLSKIVDPVDRLDVSILQNHVLNPLLGIENPRTSDRIQFVGGIRGTGELEILVDSGGFACAFSMYPTRIEDLMTIADQGGLMPPKSTWFEPKLRDAMFCHMIS